MKIVYISSPSFIDADFPLLKTLVEKGHDVYFFLKIYPNGLKSPLLDIPEIYPDNGVFDSSIYGNHIDKFKKYLNLDKIYVVNRNVNEIKIHHFKITFQLINQIKEIKPDVVHHIGWPTIPDILLTYVFRNKLILTIHDPIPHELNRLTKRYRIIRICTNWFINNYILLNKSQTDDFKRYYRINKANIHYSRLGNYELLNLYGKKIDDSAQYILFYGRISKYKGVDVLLKAFNIVKGNHPEIKLIIAGSGSFHFDLEPYENDPQVEIINRYITLEELGTLIKNSLFVVCPYISATQSGVVASTLALNKPLLVTNVGGLPEMIEVDKSGIVVPANDVEALAESLNRLLEHKECLNFMSDYIMNNSKNGVNSWNKIAEELIEIYNKSC